MVATIILSIPRALLAVQVSRGYLHFTCLSKELATSHVTSAGSHHMHQPGCEVLPTPCPSSQSFDRFAWTLGVLVLTCNLSSVFIAPQEFSGQWVVEPDPTVRDGRSLGATKLRYEISVVPTWPIPSSVVSHLVKAGLPANITAIAERAEEVRLPFHLRRSPFVRGWMHCCVVPALQVHHISIRYFM